MVGGASDARSAADNASDPFTALGSGSAAASASPNVIDPLAGLGSPARGPSLGLDDLDPLDSGEIDRGLAKLDPLAVRPRISSRVLCAVFGLLLIAAGFGIWWVCVFTEDGQSYDELVWKNLVAGVPGAVGGLMSLVAQSWLVIAISCLLAVIGVVSALVRRRWWLVGRSLCSPRCAWPSPESKGCCRVRSSSILILPQPIPRLPGTRCWPPPVR